MRRILYVGDARSPHCQRFLTAFSRRGDEVHIASFRDASLPGVRVHVLSDLGMGKLGYFAAIPQLRRLVRRIRPSVVHAHYVTSYGFLAAVVASKSLIVTAWGTDVLISPRNSRLHRWLAAFALRRAAIVTAVAEHMLPPMVTLRGKASGVHAIPLGVDLEIFGPADDSSPRPVDVVCTRNFEPVYDVASLVKACGDVQRAGQRLSVVLAGSGSLRAAVERLVVEEGLAADVTFVGHLQPFELAALLKRAKVFVSPAHSDGNNVSLNEAMACGAYPVATDIAANAQWIDHARNGHLYPPGDVAALAACLRDALSNAWARSAARSENVHIVRERASWGRSVDAVDRLYREIEEITP